MPSERVAHVKFTPRNRTVKTPSVTVTKPGYCTRVARTTADSANRAATHRCGLASSPSVT